MFIKIDKEISSTRDVRLLHTCILTGNCPEYTLSIIKPHVSLVVGKFRFSFFQVLIQPVLQKVPSMHLYVCSLVLREEIKINCKFCGTVIISEYLPVSVGMRWRLVSLVPLLKQIANEKKTFRKVPG